MIRKQTAVLKVQDIIYNRHKVLCPTSSPKYARRALVNADCRGFFSITEDDMSIDQCSRTVHEGRIVSVEFLGKRKLTRAELDEIPFEPDDKYEEESVTYSFRQWHKEGRPLRLKLHRREEYDGSFY